MYIPFFFVVYWFFYLKNLGQPGYHWLGVFSFHFKNIWTSGNFLCPKKQKKSPISLKFFSNFFQFFLHFSNNLIAKNIKKCSVLAFFLLEEILQKVELKIKKWSDFLFFQSSKSPPPPPPKKDINHQMWLSTPKSSQKKEGCL